MTLNEMAAECHEIAVVHGFWGSIGQVTADYCTLIVPAKIALIHSELSEALEAYRQNDAGGNDDSIGHELVDAIVRVLDLAYYLGVDLDLEYGVITEANRSRPYRHGKRF